MTSTKVPKNICEKYGIKEKDAIRMYDGVWKVIKRIIVSYPLMDNPEEADEKWFKDHTTAFKVIGLGTVYLPEGTYRKILRQRAELRDENGKFSKDKWIERYVPGGITAVERMKQRAKMKKEEESEEDEWAKLEAIIDNNLKNIGEDD